MAVAVGGGIETGFYAIANNTTATNSATPTPGQQTFVSKDGSLQQDEKDRGMASVFRRDDGRLRKMRETDQREKDPSFVSESYSECYPGSYETSYMFASYDSDEEEDFSKMDMGKKKRLRRWDFETDDQWNSYNENKEALPRAAFQFGVKMADGRKTRRTKQSKDSKISRDLNKINQMLKRKAGEPGSDSSEPMDVSDSGKGSTHHGEGEEDQD